MTYHVRLQQYEGPLELLVHLIESQEFDIWDIPIARITEQYLAYLAQMHKYRLDIGGEFLMMAATLLAIKARLLMPQRHTSDVDDEEEEARDPRELLARRLAAYQRVRQQAALLDGLLKKRGVVAGRGAPPLPGTVRYSRPVGDKTVDDLARTYRHILDNLQHAEPDIVRPQPLEITVEERAAQIAQLLTREARTQFQQLFGRGMNRRYVVITFLAVLSMIREGAAVVEQAEPFGPIWLERSEGGASSS